MPRVSLPAPARYFPWSRGVYDVLPGLFPFGRDFGNGDLDAKVFQFDTDFPEFRAGKLAARRERPGKYHLTRDLPAETEAAAAAFLLQRLVLEWPALFRLETPEITGGGGEAHRGKGGCLLHCALTGERLHFNPAMRLLESAPEPHPPYLSAIDALISQVPEDFAILTRRTAAGGGGEALSLLHVCAPSHWAPEEKAGLNFAGIHAPVPGFAQDARHAASLVSAMIDKGPYVRFVWSFVTDRRLNHHPEPPPGVDENQWRGRAFEAARTDGPPFCLRVERQITWGLPEVQAGLFFIRVSFVDGGEIRQNPLLRAPLLSALASMSPESRRYKGVDVCGAELTAWLTGEEA